MLLEKKWSVKDVENKLAINLAKEIDVSVVLAKILVSRGITDKDLAKDFLQGASEPFHSPFLLKGMELAVKRISDAIVNKEKMVIYGDYDVDGMTASSLLYKFLQKYSKNVDYYIPERQSEGYGLNLEALEKIASNGVTLIVTVDCGVSAVETIAQAPLTIDIIVTDHHNPPEQLPKCFAVINPKQKTCEYPYKDLAGVGVAFKLCQGLYQHVESSQEFWAEHLDLVALGTIADIVPLTGENRELVRKGLLCLRKTQNIGLEQLVKVAKVQQNKVSTGTVGFMIAPRLNAAGRLASAKVGVELLTTESIAVAQKLASQLDMENIQRQEIEKEILVQAEQLIEQQGGVKNILVLAHENWHSGVIGIVASRLVEKYHVPTMMISIGDDVCKASCRSIEAFNMYDALVHMQEYLLQYGGHKQAAGFSIAKEKIDGFRDTLVEYMKTVLSDEDYIPIQKIEVVVDDLSEINHKFVRDLAKLEPYGMGNASPVLAVKDVTVRTVSTVGLDSQHLKISVSDKTAECSAIMWRNGDYTNALYEGAKLDLAFVPEINEWRNEQLINLRIVDIKQEKMLVDFRFEANLNKESIVREILSSGKKTLFYSTKREVLLDSVHVLAFSEQASERYEQIVFLQPPYQVIKDENWWQALKVSEANRLFLLYNKKDINKELEQISIGFLKYDRLKDLYKFVREENSVDKKKLVQEFLATEELFFLDVLIEVGALQEVAGKIVVSTLKKGTKLDLCSSNIYKNAQEREMILKDSLQKCMDLSKKDLAKMLFG